MSWALIIVGTIILVVLVAVWVRRKQRDLAEVDEAEYRDPPFFHGQAGPH
ncbi:MAG: hypothetical protein ACO1PW_06635 [Actinomycetota bacterium]